MTRPEATGLRSLEFSQWVKDHFPDSNTGQCVGNLDWIFWNYKTRQLVIAEEKCFKATLRPWFKILMTEIFAPALEKYCKENKIEFGGFVVIQFEKKSPRDGKTWINGKLASEKELIERLSLKKS